MKTSEKIKRLRKENKLNKRVISKYLGITKKEYIELENNEYVPDGFNLLQKLAVLYNYDLLDFMESDEIKVTSWFRFKGITANDLKSFADFNNFIIQYEAIVNGK